MKPIILIVLGDTLELKTKSKLVKGNMKGYVLYFSGYDKRLVSVAHIESITQNEYVPLNSKGICRIPDCFDKSEELKVSLIQVNDEGMETCTESVFLYFKE